MTEVTPEHLIKLAAASYDNDLPAVAWALNAAILALTVRGP